MLDQAHVEGLEELRAQLRSIDPKLTREITKAHAKVGKLVEAEARQEMSGLPIGKAEEAAQGIRARANQTSVSLALLGANLFVRGAEFGAIIHKVFGRSVLAASMRRRVYQPWAGNADDAGYALFPTLRTFTASPRFEDVYLDAITDAAAKAFPDRI